MLLPIVCQKYKTRRPPGAPRNLDPYTTSASPRRIGASISGYSAGSYSRSASWMMIRSPVARRMPSVTAAPLPMFCGWNTGVIIEGCWPARSPMISRDPSVEPSSTSSTSRSIEPRSTASTRRTDSVSVPRSLKTGTMMLSFIGEKPSIFGGRHQPEAQLRPEVPVVWVRRVHQVRDECVAGLGRQQVIEIVEPSYAGSGHVESGHLPGVQRDGDCLGTG